MSEEFTCAYCKETFNKGQDDEAAMIECKENFGNISKQDCDVLCDDCYKAFMGWLAHNNQNQ